MSWSFVTCNWMLLLQLVVECQKICRFVSQALAANAFFWNNFHDLTPPLIPRYVKNFFKKKTARLEIWANNQKQTTVLPKYLKPVFRRQKQVIWPNVSQGHIYRCLCLLENWPTNQATAATRSVASRNGSSCVTSLRAGVSPFTTRPHLKFHWLIWALILDKTVAWSPPAVIKLSSKALGILSCFPLFNKIFDSCKPCQWSERQGGLIPSKTVRKTKSKQVS